MTGLFHLITFSDKLVRVEQPPSEAGLCSGPAWAEARGLLRTAPNRRKLSSAARELRHE